jgi:hypothetical protein
MKVFAAKVNRDRDDILALCELAGISTMSEVLDMTYEPYGELLTPKSRFLTTELLQDTLPMS